MSTIRSRSFTWSLTSAIVIALVVASCGGGSSGGGTAASASPSATTGGGGAVPTPSAAAISSGAPPSPAATEGGSGSSESRSVPDDACSVITQTDIKELFGGDVEAAESDEDENSCIFAVTNGKGLKQEFAATTPQVVTVTFDDGWIGYDEEYSAFGDAVQKVDGLGAEAWIGLGAIHVNLGDDNQLVVATTFGEIYDQQVISAERYALAKLVLSRL